MATFDIGNVYSEVTNNTKTYYIAVTCSTLVTYKSQGFKYFTTGTPARLEHISVQKLCEKWSLPIKQLDQYMSKHFSPDDDAMDRARRDKFMKQEEQEALETSNAD